MSGNSTRRASVALWKWPAIFGLWCLYGLGRTLAALGSAGHGLSEWSLARIEGLR